MLGEAHTKRGVIPQIHDDWKSSEGRTNECPFARKNKLGTVAATSAHQAHQPRELACKSNESGDLKLWKALRCPLVLTPVSAILVCQDDAKIITTINLFPIFSGKEQKRQKGKRRQQPK
jgi:hypothetical protein